MERSGLESILLDRCACAHIQHCFKGWLAQYVKSEPLPDYKALLI